ELLLPRLDFFRLGKGHGLHHSVNNYGQVPRCLVDVVVATRMALDSCRCVILVLLCHGGNGKFGQLWRWLISLDLLPGPLDVEYGRMACQGMMEKGMVSSV